MLSKQRKAIGVTVFTAVVATLGVLAYVAPGSNVAPASTFDRAPLPDRSGVSSSVRPWSEGLANDAVDSGGIEKDIDGNASALVPSDQLR